MMAKAIFQNKSSQRLLNVVMFQLGWWLLVLKGNNAIAFASILILMHFVIFPNKSKDFLLIMILVPMGIILDFCLTKAEIFQFTTVPYWLAVLWVLFILTYNHSLFIFQRWHIWKQTLIGGLFGPLSYYAGSQLDAVTLPQGNAISLFILVLVWSLFFPSSLNLARRINDYKSKTKLKE